MNTSAEFCHLQAESLGDVCVVRLLTEKLANQLDIDAIIKELCQITDPRPDQKLLLDFSAVKVISSPMLGRLITLNKQLAAGGGKLVLCNLQVNVHRVFALTRLAKTFDIKTDQAEGLAAF